MQSIYSKAEEVIVERQTAAICIVIETRGSTPRKHGAKMIVFADGSIYGTIGGGAVEKNVAERALQLIATGKPEKNTFSLEQDLGMHCGGYMEVYIEPINPLQKLIIFGAGHIGRALAHFANELDFSVTLIDPREGIFNNEEFEPYHCVNKDYFTAIKETVFDENIFIVIVTPKHLFDEQILEKIGRKPHAYLGMIGSTRKIDLMKKMFIEENILTTEELDKIDMPIGIKFDAQTPQEIAISILARLIDARNTLLKKE